MSKLDELIAKLCPDGVEYTMLQELCAVTIGEFVHKNKQDDNAMYPVYNGGISNTGFYNEYNNTANKVIISARGANAGFVNRVFQNFWAGNSCYTLTKVNDELINWNFLYYYLKSKQHHFLDGQQKGGIPAVSKKQVEQFLVPVPPLEVQGEIVRILDMFTQLTAELTARKKQYEYYKKTLMTFSDKVPTYKLGDVCTVQAGGTPSKSNTDYWNGSIKWLGSTNKKNVEEVTSYITQEGLQHSSAKLLQRGTTLIALVGATIGKVAFLPFEAAINQNIAGIYPNNLEQLDSSYVYYVCNSLYDRFLNLGKGKLAIGELIIC